MHIKEALEDDSFEDSQNETADKMKMENQIFEANNFDTILDFLNDSVESKERFLSPRDLQKSAPMKWICYEILEQV